MTEPKRRGRRRVQAEPRFLISYISLLSSRALQDVISTRTLCSECRYYHAGHLSRHYRALSLPLLLPSWLADSVSYRQCRMIGKTMHYISADSYQKHASGSAPGIQNPLRISTESEQHKSLYMPSRLTTAPGVSDWYRRPHMSPTGH